MTRDWLARMSNGSLPAKISAILWTHNSGVFVRFPRPTLDLSDALKPRTVNEQFFDQGNPAWKPRDSDAAPGSPEQKHSLEGIGGSVQVAIYRGNRPKTAGDVQSAATRELTHF
jgi:hypothetical protein